MELGTKNNLIVNTLAVVAAVYLLGAVMTMTMSIVGVINWVGPVASGFCLMGYFACLKMISLVD